MEERGSWFNQSNSHPKGRRMCRLTYRGGDRMLEGGEEGLQVI